MKKKKKVPLTKDELFAGAVMANECTGLTASVPLTDGEAESYREMSGKNVSVEKPDARKKRKSRGKARCSKGQ